VLLSLLCWDLLCVGSAGDSALGYNVHVSAVTFQALVVLLTCTSSAAVALILMFARYRLHCTNHRSFARASVRRSNSEVRLEEKVLHCCWHPSNNTVAVAGHAGLCLYKV
jgi:hypothetical protein